jgi:hypothetical protein
MGLQRTTLWLATALICTGVAFAQRPETLSSAFIVERDAGNAAQMRAEKLLNRGEPRGPESEACGAMTSALLHYVKAAAEAGAKTRVLKWSELGWDEQAAVKEKVAEQKVGPWNRNIRLHQHVCTAKP